MQQFLNDNFLNPSARSGHQSYKRLLSRVFIALFFLLPAMVWGQSEGLYYVVNHTNYSNENNRWYLVPADDPHMPHKADAFFHNQYSNISGSGDYTGDNYGDPAKPFLTTYRTKKDAAAVPTGVVNNLPDNSIWMLKASSESGYFNIIHVSTGKYVVYEYPYQAAKHRKSMHLLTIVDPDTPGENAKFKITETGSGTGLYNIEPKSPVDNNKYFNPAGNNQARYYGSTTGPYYHSGMVGLYTSATEDNSRWHTDPALCKAPDINYNSAAGTYNITWHGQTLSQMPSGYEIHYTEDGTDPTLTTGTVYDGSTITVSVNNTTVKAIVTGYGMVLSAMDEQIVNTAATPSIPTFEVTCDSKLQISCDLPEATIYYTYTDGSTDPADPDNSGSSNVYSTPITLDDGSKVKAIAYNGAINSGVSVVYTFKRRTNAPRITFSAGHVTFTFDEGTVYYTTDGTDPVVGTSASSTTSPHEITLSDNADQHVRAIAKMGDREESCPVVVAKRPKKPTVTANTYCSDGEAPERTHILEFSDTQANKTYWYALSNGSGQPAPDLNTFTQYIPGSGVHIDEITSWDRSSIWVTLHGYAKDAEDNPSTVVSQDYQLVYTASPTITYVIGETNTTVTITGEGTVKYRVDGGTETTYSAPFTVSNASHIITATAQKTDEGLSCVTTKVVRIPTNISTLEQLKAMAMDGTYDLVADIVMDNTYSSLGTEGAPFTGSLNGNGHKITGQTKALFAYTNNAQVYNLMLEDVVIEGTGHTGAVANNAKGNTRIYNVGILDGSLSAPAASNKHCGGIVGFLTDNARVINCFSYADITGGDKVGGIVGYIDESATATTRTDRHYMVMNCMFYGNISGGNDKAPIYNGHIIDNRSDHNGVNNFNYFLSTAPYVQNLNIDTYNVALAAEPRMLQRFEFYRHLLNSNRALAAWWATGSTSNVDEMYKWVMLPEELHGEHPYPMLKPKNASNNWFYYSPVNYDPENTYNPDANAMVTRVSVSTTLQRDRGGSMGSLTVTISNGSGAPSGAGIDVSSKTLTVIDKDTAMFNFNYGHVQLPYFNEVGHGNCTHYKVVTGWKITNITAVSGDPYTASNYPTSSFTEASFDAPNFNFADRASSNKDKYEISHRVFSQGAYWDVPEGVTAITIEPYWAKAVYLSDESYDMTYKADLTSPKGMERRYLNGVTYNINGNSQTVYTTMDNATTALFSGENTSGKTPYDYAVVLVGNYHLPKNTTGTFNAGSKPYTIMSADLNNDKEPDYCFIYQHTSRKPVCPIRFDFITIPGFGMAQKAAGATNLPNVGIFQPNGWFEITNTALIQLGQFEYDKNDKANAPLILMGGVIEQMVSCNTTSMGQHTIYMHIGGNVWFNEFQVGTHQDKTFQTRHVPVSVSGGEYGEFHLTGTYRSDAAIYDDNAECYINGGKFGMVSGAGNEGLGTDTKGGNVTWKIDNADMKEFYGGGLNFDKPIKGNISITIKNSYVDMFCGGPKFGDMAASKTVTTTATNCIFGTFFGAGYGGNSYNRYAPFNLTNDVNYDHNNKWNDWVNENYNHEYNETYHGVPTNFTYEFIPMSGGMSTNVARIMINHAGFSLATTRSVTSTLTGCTVRNDFYGGGNLGKVDGDVTSTLTDCTVLGSAFGAGYSALLPPIPVMDLGGFVTQPHYIEQAGVYQRGVFPPSVDYKWVHRDEVNSTATAIDEANKILYTTQDLTTLGKVVGNATLLINGTTKVFGNIYGGGNMGEVGGNTKVIVNGQ